MDSAPECPNDENHTVVFFDRKPRWKIIKGPIPQGTSQAQVECWMYGYKCQDCGEAFVVERAE